MRTFACMKKKLAYLLAYLSLCGACAISTDKQLSVENKSIITPLIFSKVEVKNEYESPCTFKKDPHKRLDNTPPFDKATKIEAISFDLEKYTEELSVQKKGHKAPVEIVNDTLFVAYVKHRYFLNPSQTQKLFETLVFNQGEDSGKMRCYEPREVLVFYQGNKPFAFLELCFSCKHWRNYKTDFKDFCDQKWETLGTFFPAKDE